MDSQFLLGIALSSIGGLSTSIGTCIFFLLKKKSIHIETMKTNIGNGQWGMQISISLFLSEMKQFIYVSENK